MKATPPQINLVALVKAILTRAKEKEGFVTKTKLFKYLYLIDVECYRRIGSSLTGFQWIFHHYGPWSQQCEEFYRELRDGGEIFIRSGSRPDLETEFVTSSNPEELEDVIDNVGLELEVRRIVDRWADQPLKELLNYVYFHTEPMEDAERGKPLDFSKVEPRPLQPITSRKEAPKKALVERMRRAIAEKKSAAVPVRPTVFTPPPYDDAYFEALRVMEDDEEY